LQGLYLLRQPYPAGLLKLAKIIWIDNNIFIVGEALFRIYKKDWNRFCYPTVNSFNLPWIGTITINPEN
jgi:hypothetical protein